MQTSPLKGLRIRRAETTWEVVWSRKEVVFRRCDSGRWVWVGVPHEVFKEMLEALKDELEELFNKRR